jgi:hypothetical protein
MKNVKFYLEPGEDPYSFIATVALPAWPQRFRSKENRAYIEYMLEREAPAHVVLRVLWLAPHDLCCFEAHYRKWLRWLACKPTCEEGYTPCKFLKFLFRTRFECLPECHECPPCVAPKASPCFTKAGEQMNPVGEYTLLNQINYLWCWEEMECREYRWEECEECEECGCEEEDVGVTAVKVGAVGVAAPTAVPLVEPDARERKRFINARLADYKKRRDDMEETAGENATLESAKKFLRAKEMTVQRFSDLADQIIGEEASWKAELTMIIGSHFLDVVTLRGGKAEGQGMKAVFDRLRNSGMDIAALFESWGAGLRPHYVGAKEFAALRGIVEGKR